MKIFGEDLEPSGNQLQERRSLCLVTHLGLHQHFWIQTGQILGFLHGCSLGCQGASRWNMPLFILSSPAAPLLYLSLLLSVFQMSVCSEQNCHKLQSYLFLKKYFLQLCFTVTCLQRWPPVILFLHTLGDTVRAIKEPGSDTQVYFRHCTL